MLSTGDEHVCPAFQPNIFDSSRCHECLRLKHLHTHAPPHTPEQVNPVSESSSREEKEQSTKEDSDDVSVVSGGSLCILSPECDLYVCDGDDSEDEDEHTCDSSQCEGDSSSTGSFTPEEEEDFFSLPHSRMTRLDPPSHRNSSRMWMEETRNRDSFSRRSSVPHVSSKVDRDRESGYFSLGRVTGARTLNDKSPSPHRHAERGHPLPSNQTPEAKATIPFRNPDLGVPSYRRTSEIHNPDLAPVPLSFSPEPVDISFEVEAQAGPRSLSPTPFKQAESLAASQKRGFRAQKSSSGQSGNFFTSKQDSTYSRSSSPSRSHSTFKRTESVSSLSSRGYGMDSVSERRDQQSKSPSRNTVARLSGPDTIQKNLKSFASTVSAISNLSKSQSSPYAELRAGLKKTEPNSGQGTKTRSPSPVRRGHDAASQSLLRKTETRNFSNIQKKSESRSSSPSRSNSQSIFRKVVEGRRSASPVRKGYGTARQSEKSLVSNGRSHNSTSSSPSRRSFEASSLSSHKSETKRHSPSLRQSNDAHTKQSALHKSESERSSLSRSPSPSKRSFDPPGQSRFHKSEGGSYSGSNRSSCNRSPSPSKQGYDLPGQSRFHKSEGSSYFGSSRSSSNRSPSPSKQGYDPPGQSRFHKSEVGSYSGSNRSSCNRSPSPSKQGYDPPGQSRFHKSEGSSYSGSSRSSSNRSPSPSKRSYDPPGQSRHRSEGSGYSISNQSSYNRSPSPSKRGYDPPGQSRHRSENRICSKSELGQIILHKTVSESRIESASYMGKSNNSSTVGSWRSATQSLHSPPISRNSSPSRKCSDSRADVRKPTHVSWSTGDQRQGQDNQSHPCRNRSPSPSIRNHTSSQSSIDSILSSGSSGLNREEYAIMADLPKVKKVLQRARSDQMEGTERGTRDETSLYKPASHSHTKPTHITWEDMVDQRGNPSPTHTPSHTQGNKMEQEKEQRVQQPDLLNFKKGWMSKQDEGGEWKKHWFVLTDAGLKYYRDSGAEEKDELDGEIDLRSCLNVSEFDVEKNYGFQIQTASGVYTLSAMTAGIRRNWIEVLRKNIRPSSTPDLTQLPDSTSDKGESRHQSSRRQSESSSNPAPAHRKFDYVELSPVATPTHSTPANQREAGEGQVREHGQGQEDKSRTVSREAATTSRRWPGKTPEQKRLEEEIERKWEEFERLPLKPVASLSALGSLQREVASLTQQAESVRGKGGVCVQGCVCEGGVCVCQCCSVSLEQMERTHKHALEELQRKHYRQTAEMEREKERLLYEETQATARAMEVLRKAHKDDLEKEVQKAKRLTTADTHTVKEQQQQELMSLRRELDGLSDRYSQKCLELNREQQSNGEKERQISMKEKEMEQLRRQNQDLQSRLTEEIRHVRSFVTGQRSEEVILDNTKGRSVCELEVLLRVKHNEVEYLHKEIMCLRNEVQFLNTEKQSVCAQYQDVREELKVLKERSEQEVQTLREHLRLSIAALQEERGLHNSI